MASTPARHSSSLRWAGYYALQRAGYYVLRLPSDNGAAHAPGGLSMQVREVSSPTVPGHRQPWRRTVRTPSHRSTETKS
jgi:hypothetical protein